MMLPGVIWYRQAHVLSQLVCDLHRNLPANSNSHLQCNQQLFQVCKPMQWACQLDSSYAITWMLEVCLLQQRSVN